jgi:hypothetical protein
MLSLAQGEPVEEEESGTFPQFLYPDWDYQREELVAMSAGAQCIAGLVAIDLCSLVTSVALAVDDWHIPHHTQPSHRPLEAGLGEQHETIAKQSQGALLSGHYHDLA